MSEERSEERYDTGYILDNLFRAKRLQGEWFALSEEEVDEFCRMGTEGGGRGVLWNRV
jgi:hypothetical protein